MILSYHPCFGADKYLICAGREPDDDDLAAIRSADAVILPQGCYKSLYEMARQNCRHVFPNFDARFKYPGKIGQIQLFRETNTRHPATATYLNLDAFNKDYSAGPLRAELGFPLVFKFDWGGEGGHVYLLKSEEDLDKALKMAKNFEKTGHTGFLMQEYILSGNKVLRVVVVGQTFISYWRIQNNSNNYRSSLARGAVIDTKTDPDLQDAAVVCVKDFCGRVGINLAGFDVLFALESSNKAPLLLEINYYFGRRGLGGSERFYELLGAEIIKWIDSIGLSLPKG